MQKPTVAIFGGSFDPPHEGHQKIVSLAREKLPIDLLLVLPAYLSPFKHSFLASPKQRLAWCHTLFGALKDVQVIPYEIEQAKSTTTIETIQYLNQTYDVKYLIIGADNLENIEKWRDFTWLNTHITWVIATRQGYPMQTEKLDRWIPLELEASISSTHLRKTQTLKYVDPKIKETVKAVLQQKKGTEPT